MKKELITNMRKIAGPLIAYQEKHWPFKDDMELQKHVERDCEIISEVEHGKFAWVFDSDETFLMEIGPLTWADGVRRVSSSALLLTGIWTVRFDREEYITTALEYGLQLLELCCRNQWPGRAFYLIDISADGAATVEAVSPFELLGIGYSHLRFAENGCDVKRHEQDEPFLSREVYRMVEMNELRAQRREERQRIDQEALAFAANP